MGKFACLFLSLPLMLQAQEEPVPAPAGARELEKAFVQVARKVLPSVVAIQIKPRLGGTEASEFWKRFFRNQPYARAEGSGVIVEASGFILTNEHVVRQAEEIRVRLAPGESLPAELRGADLRSDLAVLKVKRQGLPAIEFGDSDRVEIGQWAIALGNPFGLHNSLSVGVVSATRRSLPPGAALGDAPPRPGGSNYGNLLQTDAAINPGNSGGPLVDLQGKLIGINVLIFSQSGLSQGVGFAIPANTVKYVLEDMKAGRAVEYGWLGIAPKMPAEGVARALGLPEAKGVLVDLVLPRSPAERSGVQPGMLIVGFNGRPVHNPDELVGEVSFTRPGSKVSLEVFRPGGEKKLLQVVLGRRESSFTESLPTPLEPAPGPAGGAGERSWRGLSWEDAPQGKGVRITEVQRASPAFLSGLRAGDYLDEVAGPGKPLQKFGSATEMESLLSRVTGPVLLHSNRSGYVMVEEK